ncbi:MAG: hypothetical protein R2844_03460 [Caldilineales bacterium]
MPPGSQVVVLGNISPATEPTISLHCQPGRPRLCATMTSFSSGGSTDTIVDVIGSDGATVLETDDDSGSFSSTSSAIGGTIIPATGTYYIKVDGFSGTSSIMSITCMCECRWHAYFGNRAEQHPDTANLAASGWMSRHHYIDDRP